MLELHFGHLDQVFSHHDRQELERICEFHQFPYLSMLEPLVSHIALQHMVLLHPDQI
jgi:hypothetical protein